MRRRLLAGLTATAAVAASLLIGSAGAATAAPETVVDSTSAASRGGSGVTPNADLPAAIRVTDPNLKIVATLRGVGKQVYDCAPGATAYTPREPVATLSSLRGAPVGIHGAGPFWAGFDGSRVEASKVAGAKSPAGTSNVDWLLLDATRAVGGGTFGKVEFVQRTDTRGGAAPATCGAPTIAVDYSTIYVFWAPK